ARLIEKFHRADPIDAGEVAALNDLLKHALVPLQKAIYENPVRVLLGAAGSFETLVDIVLKDFQTIPIALSKHAYEIQLSLFDIFYELMLTSNREQRAKLRGMADFRVDMIAVASILIKHVIEQFKIERLITSDYSLKEGMLYSL